MGILQMKHEINKAEDQDQDQNQNRDQNQDETRTRTRTRTGLPADGCTYDMGYDGGMSKARIRNEIKTGSWGH